MPGLLVAVRPDGLGQQFSNQVGRAASLLLGLQTCTEIISTPSLWLADVDADRHAAQHVEDGLAVICYGAACDRTTDRPLSIQELWRRIATSDRELNDAASGSFLVLTVDHHAQRLRVYADQTASVPLFYAAHNRRIAMGPEAKAIFPLLGMRPSLDSKTAVAFLVCGHPLGDRTHFSGVSRLGPGQKLTVDLQSGHHTVGTYWRLRFDPRPQLSISEAEEELYCAWRSGVERNVRPNQLLLLTGGYDSRCILGLAREHNVRYELAATWADRIDIPLSDPTIAGLVAAQAGVPHRVLSYEASDFASNAATWAWKSELSSDNLGFFAAGGTFLLDGVPDVKRVVVGDQLIGPGGWPRNTRDAARAICRASPETTTQALLPLAHSDAGSFLAEVFWEQIDQLVSDLEVEHPKDVHDSLYLYVYVYRWLHSAAFFREPVLAADRPLMTGRSMDLLQQLPRAHRVDKRVLHEMMRRRMPDLYRLPLATANSLIDWDYEARNNPVLRSWLMRHLEPERVLASPVSQLIETDKLVEAVASYMAEPVERLSREPRMDGQLAGLRRRVAALPGGRVALAASGPVAHWITRSRKTASRTRTLFRIAMLVCLQERVKQNIPLDGFDN